MIIFTPPVAWPKCSCEVLKVIRASLPSLLRQCLVSRDGEGLFK